MSGPVANLNRRGSEVEQLRKESNTKLPETDVQLASNSSNEMDTSSTSINKKKASSPDLLSSTILTKSSSSAGNRQVVSKSSSSNVQNSKPISNEKDISNRAFWRFVVMIICIVWSTNFAVIKAMFEAVPTMDASLYSAVRFTIAAVVMLPRTINSWGNCQMIAKSMIMSFFVFLGYFGQGVGMSLGASADKSAFICSLNCVWVALIQGILQAGFKLQTWLSVLFAVTGVAMLELNGSMPVTPGDVWLILQPIGFGSGYVILESIMGDYPNDAAAITSFKLLFIGFFSIVWCTLNGKTWEDLKPILHSTTAIAGLLYCSLVTTVLALWAQSIAFKKVTAKDVSIILCTEPIWATVFSACKILFYHNIFKTSFYTNYLCYTSFRV
jgi:drug/metabolite transporter (DMT)-like permease